MLVVSEEPLPSKTHSIPVTFFGDLRLLGTELEVAVKCIPAKGQLHLQRVVDSVHRCMEGVQHENVAKPLVVEKAQRTARIATELATASLEDLLSEVESPVHDDADAAASESVLKDLGIEWHLETKKEIAVQVLRGLAHLHRKFAEKADAACR